MNSVINNKNEERCLSACCVHGGIFLFTPVYYRFALTPSVFAAPEAAINSNLVPRVFSTFKMAAEDPGKQQVTCLQKYRKIPIISPSKNRPSRK